MASLRPAEEGGRPSLLLVHGFAGRRQVWGEVSALLARDHRVLAVDLPGSGGLPGPPLRDGEADFEAIARSLAHQARDSGLAPCSLVAHSMGAPLAALALLRDPGAFRALVLVEGALRPGPPLPAPLWECFNRDLPAFLERFLLPRCSTAAQGRRLLEDALAMDPHVLAGYLRHLGREGLHGRQSLIRPPVAVFASDAPSGADPGLPAWKDRHGLGLLPRLQVERFPGCGHWIMWDDPEGFADRLRAFEGSLGTGPP